MDDMVTPVLADGITWRRDTDCPPRHAVMNLSCRDGIRGMCKFWIRAIIVAACAANLRS